MKFLLLTAMIFISSSVLANDYNDNEQMALDFYGEHDISVYYMKDDVVIKDKQIPYKE